MMMRYIAFMAYLSLASTETPNQATTPVQLNVTKTSSNVGAKKDKNKQGNEKQVGAPSKPEKKSKDGSLPQVSAGVVAAVESPTKQGVNDPYADASNQSIQAITKQQQAAQTEMEKREGQITIKQQQSIDQKVKEKSDHDKLCMSCMADCEDNYQIQLKEIELHIADHQKKTKVQMLQNLEEDKKKAETDLTSQIATQTASIINSATQEALDAVEAKEAKKDDEENDSTPDAEEMKTKSPVKIKKAAEVASKKIGQGVDKMITNVIPTKR